MKKLGWLSALGLGAAAAVLWRNRKAIDPYATAFENTEQPSAPVLQLPSRSPGQPSPEVDAVRDRQVTDPEQGAGLGSRSTHAVEASVSALADYIGRHRRH